jgi:uncharacterized membrane protein YhaH (DUF805 family)
MISFFTRFDGRASRREFWYGFAGLMAVQVAVAALLGLANIPPAEPVSDTILALVRAALLVPLFALVTRRCNDLALPDSSLRQFIGLASVSTLLHLVIALRLGPAIGLSLVQPLATMLTQLFDLATTIWMVAWLTLPSGDRASTEPSARQP